MKWLETLGWTEDHIEDLRDTGYAYLRQGKYDIALPFFEALVVLNPSSAYDVQTLGAVHLQMNEPMKAIPFFNKALELETQHAPTLINLAKALLMINKRSEALQLAKALENDRDPVIANAARALVLAFG